MLRIQALFCCLLIGTSVVAQERGYRLLVADSSKGRIAIVAEDGLLAWEYKIGPLHDLHSLPNGNVLFQSDWRTIIEVDPKTNQLVWSYQAGKDASGRRVEVHAFQRLENGNTLIAESGIPRLIEVDASGEISHEIAIQVSQSHPHRDTRLVRKLPSGNYLVCHEGDGRVTEYSETGAIVWDYQVPLFDRPPASGHGPEAYGNQCFAALRLDSGNTLIATGNGHRVLEVTPAKQIVWKLEQDELPAVQLAWVTTLQVLPSGNIVIGNCHAGEENPQIIEITREKKVVWQFHDFEHFGNSLTNSQVLSIDGSPIIARPGVDR